ncbi:SH3 domain-containing protein [Aquabacter cavernae]|uniref:SH3 domain-containing protein n=1 Tax=Aquabacter cavernae TaxID=2496029 RepID=UPI0013E01E07
MFASTKANVRSSPYTSAPIVSVLDQGEAVETIGEQNGWHRTPKGWVAARLLTEAKPAKEVLLAQPTPTKPAASQPARETRPAPGTPIRGSYLGTCDCPYDRKRNGAICGGSSAYSRPGGRNPVCYH